MRGASALEALLETQTDSHLRVFVIWEPVLATDLSAPSTITLRRIHDPRVKQYWDRNRVLSHAMGEHDRPSVVWDYIAVYKPERIWTDAPPQSDFTGRPVVRFIEGAREQGAVLVHCAAGASRSATFVLAYLMVANSMTLKEAVRSFFCDFG